MLGLDPLRIRPMESELGLLHKCDGSARVKQGENIITTVIQGENNLTVVLAAVVTVLNTIII